MHPPSTCRPSVGRGEANLSHLDQLGPTIVAIDQAQDHPHDQTPLSITGGMLARSRFRVFAPDSENGFVSGSKNFVVADALKSVHGVAKAISIRKRDLCCLADALRLL